MQAHSKAPGRGNHGYPADDDLVKLMRLHRAYGKVAKACGVRRESLRDYLSIRPELKSRMDVHSVTRDWEARTEEERSERNRASQRRYQARMQRKDPERKREINRRWAKNQSPEQRAKWNNRNRLRRKVVGADQHPTNVPAHLYRDPCSYCGGPGGTVDHIVPIALGGANEPCNYAAACHSCNCSKKDDDLLIFLLRR